MSRFFAGDAKSLFYDFWLVFASDGKIRVTREPPSTSRNERAMKMRATLPRTLFKTPELTGTIKIAEPDGKAFEVDVQALADTVKEVMGLDVVFEIKPPQP